jgi:hypothetical protein
MPSTDQTDGQQLPDESPHGHLHHPGGEWLVSRLQAVRDRIGSYPQTLRDRSTSRHVVDSARAVSVGSIAAVIVITYLATRRGVIEMNPITRALIVQGGWTMAALVSIGTTAIVYELYARLASGFWRFPAVPLLAVGAALCVSVFNVANLVNDLQVLYTVGLPERVVIVELLWILTVTTGLAVADTLGHRMFRRLLDPWTPERREPTSER